MKVIAHYNTAMRGFGRVFMSKSYVDLGEATMFLLRILLKKMENGTSEALD